MGAAGDACGPVLVFHGPRFYPDDLTDVAARVWTHCARAMSSMAFASAADASCNSASTSCSNATARCCSTASSTKVRSSCRATRGALLLAEPRDEGTPQLRTMFFAALTHEPVVVAAYDLPPPAHMVLDVSFDERHHYRRRSMLIVPMVDHRDRLVGVLLFINRKTDPKAKIATKADADRG